MFSRALSFLCYFSFFSWITLQTRRGEKGMKQRVTAHKSDRMQWSLYNLCCRVKVFSHEKEIFDDKKKRQLEKCDIEFVRERKASEENKIEGKLKERWCKKLHDDTKKKEKKNDETTSWKFSWKEYCFHVRFPFGYRWHWKFMLPLHTKIAK